MLLIKQASSRVHSSYFYGPLWTGEDLQRLFLLILCEDAIFIPKKNQPNGVTCWTLLCCLHHQGSTGSQVPQNKYAELLSIIEELGKEIRPTYAGSKSAMERLKRGNFELDHSGFSCVCMCVCDLMSYSFLSCSVKASFMPGGLCASAWPRRRETQGPSYDSSHSSLQEGLRVWVSWKKCAWHFLWEEEVNEQRTGGTKLVEGEKKDHDSWGLWRIITIMCGLLEFKWEGLLCLMPPLLGS